MVKDVSDAILLQKSDAQQNNPDNTLLLLEPLLAHGLFGRIIGIQPRV